MEHSVHLAVTDERGNPVAIAEVSGNAELGVLVTAANIKLFQELAALGYNAGGAPVVPDTVPEQWGA